MHKTRGNKAEEKVRLRLALAKGKNSEIDKPGTCFAGIEHVCTESLTPNPKRAEALRKAKYW